MAGGWSLSGVCGRWLSPPGPRTWLFRFFPLPPVCPLGQSRLIPTQFTPACCYHLPSARHHPQTLLLCSYLERLCTPAVLQLAAIVPNVKLDLWFCHVLQMKWALSSSVR